MIEIGEVDGNFSQICFFLPATTDRSEEVNQYLNNDSITPIDINRNQVDTWSGTSFNPSKFDFFDLEKNTMSDAVMKCLRHINDISNSNVACNADGLFSRRKIDVPVDWVSENKCRVPPQKLKASY